MPRRSYRHPGVYVQEKSASPVSVTPVDTAVVAFFGYADKAERRGKSCYGTPVRISSFQEFETVFGAAKPSACNRPQYHLQQVASPPPRGVWVALGSRIAAVCPDPDTVYYMARSVRLFFDNGGREAVVVAVGDFGTPSGQAAPSGAPVVNRGVRLADLQKGFQALERAPETTMYVCPDACLLPHKDQGALMQSMLRQAEATRAAVCLFDIAGGDHPDASSISGDIDAFRRAVGQRGLSFGAAYYPFLNTSLLRTGDIDCRNFEGGDVDELQRWLSMAAALDPTTRSLLDRMREASQKDERTVEQLHAALLQSFQPYAALMDRLLAHANTVPASGAVAGAIASVDVDRGVWKAPANVELRSVVDVPLRLTDAQQEPLNIDSAEGKSINAIRYIDRRGIRIWGARTLAGNDPEWRYLSVRRTALFIEQSIQAALKAFVEEPNEPQTWQAAKRMIEGFLMELWKNGAFQGAKPEDAFFVKVGLGETMSQADVDAGRLVTQLGFAPLRPAEFVALSIDGAARRGR